MAHCLADEMHLNRPAAEPASRRHNRYRRMRARRRNAADGNDLQTVEAERDRGIDDLLEAEINPLMCAAGTSFVSYPVLAEARTPSATLNASATLLTVGFPALPVEISPLPAKKSPSVPQTRP